METKLEKAERLGRALRYQMPPLTIEEQRWLFHQAFGTLPVSSMLRCPGCCGAGYIGQCETCLSCAGQGYVQR